MPTTRDDLWSLVLGRQAVDPLELTEALEHEMLTVARPDLDFRTRLLVRDSIVALRDYWGEERVNDWLAKSGVGEEIEAILKEDLGETGFSFLRNQLMDPTRPDTIRQFLRELGGCPRRRTALYIGGSVSLLMPGYLVRRTQDLDVVDEVPEEIRTSYNKLNDLINRYQLRVAHFQSHYLPAGWKDRVHSQGMFGNLDVYLVDVYDVFVSKLFSQRTKDLDDLRALVPQLDKDVLVNRLREHGKVLRADERLLPHAEKNWYILYGEALPS